MLVEGRALRRITAVTEEDGRIVAETDGAALDELIEEGTLAWKQEINVASFSRATLVMAESEAALRGEAAGRRTACEPSISGMTVRFECAFEGADADAQPKGGVDAAAPVPLLFYWPGAATPRLRST